MTMKLSNNYSTEAKVIGKWIDGKPIYQKTFSGTTDATNETTVVGTINNLKMMLDVEGCVNWSDGTNSGWDTTNYNRGSGDNYVDVATDGNRVELYVAGSWHKSRPYYVTIRYTLN